VAAGSTGRTGLVRRSGRGTGRGRTSYSSLLRRAALGSCVQMFQGRRVHCRRQHSRRVLRLRPDFAGVLRRSSARFTLSASVVCRQARASSASPCRGRVPKPTGRAAIRNTKHGRRTAVRRITLLRRVAGPWQRRAGQCPRLARLCPVSWPRIRWCPCRQTGLTPPHLWETTGAQPV